MEAGNSQVDEYITSRKKIESSKKWYLENRCTIGQLKEIIKDGNSQVYVTNFKKYNSFVFSI